MENKRKQRLTQGILNLLAGCFDAAQAGGFEQQEEVNPASVNKNSIQLTEQWLMERASQGTRKPSKPIVELLAECFYAAQAGGFEEQEEIEPGISDCSDKAEQWLVDELKQSEVML